MNFLVVDDNRLLNRFLTTYLRGKGHGAASLTDSSKVEAWLELNSCDAIILDIGMPNLNGYEAARLIRNESWGRDVKLIALTGYGREADSDQALKSGFDVHLAKPAPADRLLREVARLLGEGTAAQSREDPS